MARARLSPPDGLAPARRFRRLGNRPLTIFSFDRSCHARLAVVVCIRNFLEEDFVKIPDSAISAHVPIRLCALGAALGMILAVLALFPPLVPEVSAHGEREAIINSCESWPSRVTEGDRVTFSARVTNREAGFSTAVLYVVFHVYHGGREVYKYKTSTRSVSRGSGTTFTSPGITAGSSRLPDGRSEIVCGLWRDNTVGADTLQEHTGGSGSGHPIASASVIVKENSPPKITRTSPSRSSVDLETGDSQEFEARATDVDGNLESVEWTLNGRELNQCSETIDYERNHTSDCSLSSLSAGSYTLEVTFRDRLEEDDDHTWNITVNRPEPVNRPPRITRQTPNRSSVNLEEGDSQEFSADVTDPDGNLDTVEWTMDGSRVCRSESSVSGSSDSSECEVDFDSEGTYRLVVTFTDSRGVDDDYTWNITVEGEPEVNDPFINRTTPRSSVTLEEGDSQEFTARASDDDGDLEAVEWRLDGDTECRESISSRSEYTSSCEVDFDSEGTYRLVVTFTDSRGAPDSDRWDITVEREHVPPEIYDTSPDHRQTLSLKVGQSQEFNASARDADGDLESVEWTLDGSFQCGASIRSGSDHTSDCELRFSREGRYRLVVTFTDSREATDSETWSITVVEPEPEPPEIYDTSPDHRQTLRLEVGQSREFTASARDPDGDLASVEWTLDGSEREQCGQSIDSRRDYTSDCELRFSREGRYRLQVTFNDSRGATDSERWSITVAPPPNGPPKITRTSPDHSQTLRLKVGQSQEFTASVSDPDGNLASVEWKLDGSRVCRNESSVSGSSDSSDCELDFDSEGTYRLQVTFTDSAGEDDDETWRIGVTNSPPEITGTSLGPSSQSLNIGASLYLTARATDPDGNLASVEWTLDGRRQQCGEPIRSGRDLASACELDFDSEGTYRLQVTFTDSVGASASATWSIAVVNRPPEIYETSPGHSVDTALKTGRHEFTAKARDPDGNLASVEWTLDGRRQCGVSSGSGSSACELDFDSEGTYRLQVTFTDRSGASASATWSIAVVNRPPEIYETSPGHSVDTALKTGRHEFTAKARDPDGNLASVEWTLDGSEQCGKSISGRDSTSSCAFTFSSDGDYRIEVTFTDSIGASDSVGWRVGVAPTPTPVPIHTPTPTPTNSPPEIYSESPAQRSLVREVGQSQEFTAKASDSDENLSSVEWTLNGSRYQQCDDSVSSRNVHVSPCSVHFSSEGSYSLEVVFTDDRGATDSATWKIDVVPPPTATPPEPPTATPTKATPEEISVGDPPPEEETPSAGGTTNIWLPTAEPPPTNTPTPESQPPPDPPEESGGCGSATGSLPFGTAAANLALLLGPLGLIGIRKLIIRRR